MADASSTPAVNAAHVRRLALAPLGSAPPPPRHAAVQRPVRSSDRRGGAGCPRRVRSGHRGRRRNGLLQHAFVSRRGRCMAARRRLSHQVPVSERGTPTERSDPDRLRRQRAPTARARTGRLVGSVPRRVPFSWQDREYRADDAGLISLGRALRDEPSLADDAARKIGAEQFKINPDQLREQFIKDRSASDHLLVAFAAGQGDGTSGVRTEDGAFQAHREQLERFADLMFTSNEKKDRRCWLGTGRSLGSASWRSTAG